MRFVQHTMQTADYYETLTKILVTLNLVAPWTHQEFVGSVVMAGGRTTWLNGEHETVYHISSDNPSTDDVLIACDYDDCLVRIIAPSRSILGYSAPAESITKQPIFDGSTLKAYFFDGQWRLASRNAVNVYNLAMNTETFGDAFSRLSGDLDKSKVYVINLATTINCPLAGTKDACRILEEITIRDGSIVVNTTEFTETTAFGYAYRTVDGVYLDRSDAFVDLGRVIYDVPRGVLRRLGNQSRRIYVITRAILLGWDTDFGTLYPSMSVDYISIRDFIVALVRHIFTMCCSRTRNPNVLGSFVYQVSNKIGPLKSKTGRNIVVDTLYSKEYIEAVTEEYLKAASRR